MSANSFFCSDCGKEHPGLATDWGFKLPDEVHALSNINRYERTRHNADVCTLDESRHFIRGVLSLPIVGSGQEFSWGVWVEVSRDTHDLYVKNWSADISAEPRAAGTVANNISVYQDERRFQVEVQFNAGNDRPSFFLPEDANSAIALEQRHGISVKRQHGILEALGCFKDGDN